MPDSRAASPGFPQASPALEAFGMKFTGGGPHASRTMMLAELEAVLAAVPLGADAATYRAAILDRNALGKSTDSTRLKSLRHLRELYALDESVPIFGLLRQLQAIDTHSLPLLALQVAWSRDPLLRATTPPVLEAAVGAQVDRDRLVESFEAAFPRQYSMASSRTATQNAASSWVQAGHLSGRVKKHRREIRPTVVALTMALFLGHVAGYHGAAVFSNPWCALLGLGADRARTLAQEAHRAGLLDLRAVGDVVEIGFPQFSAFLTPSP